MTKTFCTLIVIVLLPGFILSACGSSGDSGCTENETQECLCPGGATGMQTCDANGSFSECDCSGTQCNDGYRDEGAGCVDINECSEDIHGCHPDAYCTNMAGSFSCTCNAGFTGDGSICQDVNECTADTHDCDENASCENTAGSFTCACNQGYDGSGVTCEDINECTEDTHDCDENASCENTTGSYTCTCNTHYVGDGTTCDLDECASGAADCDENASCENTVGSYTCTCIDGYDGDGSTCTDVNECTEQSHECHEHATCENTIGSYDCTCVGGYDGDGMNCVNVDECTAETHTCHANATCYDTDGSYTCECNEGYLGDGFSCSMDINTYVADISDRPVYILIEDFGAFTIHAMSRVGWDIEVIETPVDEFRTHKDPGLILYPEITMRDIRGPHYALEYLAAWMGADDPEPKMITMTLVGLGAEELVVEIYNVLPVGGDATLTPEDGYWSFMSELVIEFGADPVGMGFVSYQAPIYPACFLPGHQIEISGVQVGSCWPLGTLELPAIGSSDPLFIPDNRDGGTLFRFMEDVTQEWTGYGILNRKDCQVIEKDAEGYPVAWTNIYQAWPAAIHLFNPIKPYGYSYLVDMLIVDDNVEQGH